MAGPSPQLPLDIENLFGDLFRSFFEFSNGVVTLELSEEEAADGTKRDVTFDRLSPCKTCDGRGSENPDAVISVCPACTGTGKRLHTQGAFQLQSTCDRCKGDARYVSDPCTACEGRGACKESTTQTVTIPGGIAHEQRLKLTGAGSQLADGTRGDVYITVLIAGRPRSKLPMPVQVGPASLPEARVHRPGPVVSRTQLLVVLAIAAFFAAMVYAGLR